METRRIEAANEAAWSSFVERMSNGRRAANPEPTVRLQCPTLRHGEGVLLYVAGASGVCHCGRTLRTLAPWEILSVVDGRVVPISREDDR